MIEVDNKDRNPQEDIVLQTSELLEKYILVKSEAEEIEEFLLEVNLKISAGYNAIGGVSVLTENSVDFLLQAMVKY